MAKSYILFELLFRGNKLLKKVNFLCTIKALEYISWFVL